MSCPTKKIIELEKRLKNEGMKIVFEKDCSLAFIFPIPNREEHLQFWEIKRVISKEKCLKRISLVGIEIPTIFSMSGRVISTISRMEKGNILLSSIFKNRIEEISEFYKAKQNDCFVVAIV